MIRTGEQYRESLRDGRQVWINGEKVKDVTVHPAFKPIVDVRARIYDMAHDAKTRDLMSYVDKDSNLFRVLTSAGITLQHEIDLLKLTRELDMVSVGLAFDEEDSLRVVGEAQPDIFCFHAGTTKGGLKGFDSGETIEETAERTEQVIQKLRALKKDIILVAHGAAMETPEDAQFMLDHTSCDGFWTGSSTERIPIERVMNLSLRFRRTEFVVFGDVQHHRARKVLRFIETLLNADAVISNSTIGFESRR